MDTVRVYDKQELENINKVLRKDKNNKYFTQQELEIANEINQRKEDKCMNNKLELVKSFKFNEVECNIYSKDNEMFMTINQLAEVLGYASKNGIEKLISRNPYLRENEFSVIVSLGTDSLGGTKNTRIFTEDGIYEITMLSKTETGKKFRKVVREVIKSLRKGENSLDTNGLMKQLAESQITLNNVLAGFKMQIDNDLTATNNKLNEIFEVGTYRELPSIKYEDIIHTISGLTIGIRDIQNEVY